MRREGAGEFRRAVGLTLPVPLVTALDAALRDGETRSSLVEALIRSELRWREVSTDE